MRHDKHHRRTPDQPYRDLPARRFWKAIDREAFELAVSGNDKYDAFLQALHDPNYSRCSFPTLLRKFNISLHEAQSLYTDHMRYLGLLRMSSQLPEIMAGVAEDALSHMQACPRCDGLKLVESTRANSRTRRECPNCEGTGKVRVMGDRHARDLVFESMKLIKQPSGPLVAIQQNIDGNGRGLALDAKLEDLLKLTQSIMLGSFRNERPVAEDRNASAKGNAATPD